MATDIWMPLFTGDLLRDTQRLSNAQVGAYIKLLVSYWTQGPIPEDDQLMMRISGCSQDDLAELKLALKHSFRSDKGVLMNDKLDKEKEKAEKRSKRGKAGAAGRSANLKNLRSAKDELKKSLSVNTSPSPSQEDISKDTSSINNTSDQEKPSRKKTSKKTGREYTPEFLEFKAAYPKRDGPSSWPGTFKAWNAALKRGANPSQIVSGAIKYAKHCQDEGKIGTRYVRLAQTFLNQDGWQDEYQAPQSASRSAYQRSMDIANGIE